jgi:hypothetical protein
MPTSDSDSALTLYQPDLGFMWEIQGFHWITSMQWQGNSLSRMSTVNTRTTGHFVNWVTGPGHATPGATYSTYELAAWGIQGSGLPYAPGVLAMSDIRRNYVNHALLLEVYDAAAGSHVWPAARGDGGAGSTNPAFVLSEGMWLRLPAGYPIPSVDPITSLFVQAARDFGLVITDRTLSCLAVRAMSSCATAIGLNNHLVGFPWADLECTVPGSDTVWHP